MAPFTGLSSAFDMEFWNSREARRAEIASANGLASARSLAVVAGHLATPGASFPLSPPAWQEMHDFPTEGSTFGMKTNFTQGGVNKFEEEGGRDGYYGWFGYGGSVFQWHPDLRIGFAMEEIFRLRSSNVFRN